MTREQIIQILEEEAVEFDAQVRILATTNPLRAEDRRRHAAALREAVEILRGEATT